MRVASLIGLMVIVLTTATASAQQAPAVVATIAVARAAYVQFALSGRIVVFCADDKLRMFSLPPANCASISTRTLLAARRM